MFRARVNDGLREIYIIMVVNEGENEKRRISKEEKPKGRRKTRAMQFTGIPLIAMHRYVELAISHEEIHNIIDKCHCAFL